MKFLRLLYIKFILFTHYWAYRRNSETRGVHIRQALEKLGPIFVKFGQLLSTRRDMLPDDIVDELEKLQDQVPPFDGAIAQGLIEKVFKKPIQEIFAAFEPIPLASASIAQVHAVTLHDGKSAVIKILRPNIEKIIRSDIALLYTVAYFIQKYWSEGYRIRPREIVAEFEQTLLAELNLLHEAANAAQLRRNFQHSPLLHIPEIYWPYARKSMIVMERIRGIPVSNMAELKAAGINMKRLAERGVEIFFTQVFRDCFFHADMHPGNLFVSP
ncbi:MAG: AarF/UbiB family protein, partial [Gammaproteobacteria bacterium]